MRYRTQRKTQRYLNAKSLAVPTFLQRLKSCKIIFTLEDTFRVFERMRKACTIDYAETGSRKFSRDEWLTKGQVQSFFSRLSAISRKRGVTRAENVESDDEGDLLLHEEMACLIDERRDKEIEDISTRWT